MVAARGSGGRLGLVDGVVGAAEEEDAALKAGELMLVSEGTTLGLTGAVLGVPLVLAFALAFDGLARGAGGPIAEEDSCVLLVDFFI